MSNVSTGNQQYSFIWILCLSYVAIKLYCLFYMVILPQTQDMKKV